MNNRLILGFLPRSRFVGYGLIAVPVVFLIIFAVGEFFGGQLGGLVHLIQLAPLLFLALFARVRMRIAGMCLMVVSVVLGAFYVIAMQDLSIWTIGLVEAILFLPPFLAGLFFTLLSR